MRIDRQRFVDVIDEIAYSLRRMAEAGIRRIECSDAQLDAIRSWGHPGPRPASTSVETLEDIRADLGDCMRCKLCKSRTQIVFGQGDPQAKLLFIGEGPGQEEDLAGEPFVGAAGQLLTRIIEAIQLKREAVYIANVVKCRPPSNRVPEPDEIAACRPFLQRQIAAIRPQFICTLGACAAQTLLDTTEPISKLRGQFYDYGGCRVMPTFHPAYLLRNPEKKRDVWEDMKRLMKEYPYASRAE
jgi:uracil-DNA glycosylase